ncbi:MAG: hypothetical protein ACPHID_08515, partial [Thermoplasmatota archaeon]
MGTTNVQPASLSVLAVSQHTWTFTPEDTFEATGAVRATYPSGFDVSNANAGTCTGGTLDGSFTTTVS